MYSPSMARSDQRQTSRRSALVFDERMPQHASPFEDRHPECPERFTVSLERIRHYKLEQRCVILPSRAATEAELELIHSRKHIDLAKSLDECTDTTHLEELLSHYDSVFMNKHSYKLALLSAGCTIDLMKAVLGGSEVRTGMAVIRPPGHHAMAEEFCGYCIFNNVAIAAKYAVEKMGLERVLIVDWDVHHGQGTQFSFYDDPRVLYFSIHRYEHGSFWPELRESNWDCIGKGPGTGYNINVPLNKVGMENWDYAAIFHQILLPVASEFRPELILVSSGFDASLGDPEGEMRVTPAMYAHMTHMLKQLGVPLAIVLEGGYCLPALAESVAQVLKTLLGDPCPPLINNREDKAREPNDTIKATIGHVKSALKPYWRCFISETSDKIPLPIITYRGILGICKPEKYPTKNYHMRLSEEVEKATLQEQAVLRARTPLTTASSQDAVKILDTLDGIEDLASLKAYSYLLVNHITLASVQSFLGTAHQLIIDFESEPSVSVSHETNRVSVFPKLFELNGRADCFVLMYSLILPLFYKMYPEWVIIRVGGSPLRDLLSLCCAHLSCEGALWIIDGDSWEPLPIVLPSDFDSVDATAARRRIQEAAKAVGFGLDSFIKDVLPIFEKLPLDHNRSLESN
ncbi:histone deacetylase 10-like isoform X1 [Varroa destructor]|uniref:Histone deacetylase domain-containing protein n=2 Tax=Varroa destructor TaxID=109461 RepID=A0A7M7JV83_VARDE|nr:histone deacetylase 10-like isoform X1 [Varroa destructor]